MRVVFTFFTSIVAPRSQDEDSRRQEFILNVLLVSIVTLISCAFAVHVAFLIFGLFSPEERRYAFPLVGIVSILGFFVFLYVLARQGRTRASSLTFLTALYLLATYMAYGRGFDVPVSALFYVLIIVMAGVLIGTRFAFAATAVIAVTITVIGYIQTSGIYLPSQFWKTQPGDFADVTMTTIVFLIIATVSWLSNREIEKSLARARRSEAELKEERDLLEVRVAERTQQLRLAEMEKMSQAYRFVEFGRLAGGFFHDLANPLLALSLNIEHIAEVSGRTRSVLSEDIARAKRATEHIQTLMSSLRRHLAHESERTEFSPAATLRDLIDVLAPYARTKGVTIELAATDTARIYGGPVAFTQVCTNLISNAVESYPSVGEGDGRARRVVVTLTEDAEAVCVAVRDQGAGIPADKIESIFEPFFTTKGSSRGLGIGLPLAKRIVEKEFGGTVHVYSVVGTGTTFTVCFPSKISHADIR